MNLYISSPGNTTRILNEYGIRLKKNLGQNFLIDTNSAKKIVKLARICPEDIILEVGSGIGSLTEILLARAKKVVCVEIDKLLIKAFNDIFSVDLSKKSKIELIQADALKLDYNNLAGEYSITKVISNLPYSIAATLLLKILLEAEQVKKMILTVQRDIAERILAPVGDKNYSSYTVKANFLAHFNFLFQISRSCFIPRPFVDSSVIEVSRKEDKLLESSGFDIRDFFDFIDSCFLHRRKKLINSLAQSNMEYCHKAELIIKLLSVLGKDKNARAQELDIKDYIYMYKNLISNM
jgi:16S rRNA (adenine1518-N6/adenine1519-N6)-dimethyltransferase